MKLGKKRLKILTIISLVLIVIISLKYINYNAEYNAKNFCENSYLLQDKNKIISAIPKHIKEDRKNSSISNSIVILRFHTFFITRYECSMLFDEDDKIISAKVSYSD